MPRRLAHSLALALLLAAGLVAPAQAQTPRTVRGPQAALIGQLTDLTPWLGALVGVRAADSTVVVGLVAQPVDGLAWQAGDVVQAIDGTPVASIAEAQAAFEAVPVGEAVRFDLLRADAPQTLTLPRPDPADVPTLRLQRQTVGGDGER
jgi:S1-C subfamily serine protease